MATESVTSNDNGSSNLWGALLKHVPVHVDASGNLACSLPADELGRVENSAQRMIGIIVDGFSAIGELQWRAAAYDNGSIDAEVFGLLAPLQTQLAELMAALRVTESNAGYYLREQEAAAKEAHA